MSHETNTGDDAAKHPKRWSRARFAAQGRQAAPLNFSRLLWLLVPAAGIVEALASVYFSRRFPRPEEWSEVRAAVSAVKGRGDLVVIAPDWAEPLARQAFTDSLMPIGDLARPDESNYQGAVEVSALGAESPLVSNWPLLQEVHVGKFVIRKRKNLAFRPPVFVLTEHAAPPFLSVVERRGEHEDVCRYQTAAKVTAGGLLGHPTFPRERFVCGPAESDFVGVTIVDDQTYRPRRCLWANPSAGGRLILRFTDVPMRDELYGYIGLPYFTYRDHGWPPVGITASVAGLEIGAHSHWPERGWQPFKFTTSQFSGRVETVEFSILGLDSQELQLCFFAATR